MYGRHVPSMLKCQLRLSTGGRTSTEPTRVLLPSPFASMPCVNGQASSSSVPRLSVNMYSTLNVGEMSLSTTRLAPSPLSELDRFLLSGLICDMPTRNSQSPFGWPGYESA